MRLGAVEELSRAPLTRRQLLAGAGAASFALLLAACTGGDGDAAPQPPTDLPPPEPPPVEPAETIPAPPPPPSDAPPSGPELADGMIGGPTGFVGADRYQYPLDSDEGSAIEAIRRLRQDGAAPDRIVVQVLDYVRPQLETGFPNGAPSVVELFEAEAGIAIEFAEVEASAAYRENLASIEAGDGSLDVVTFGIEEIGDLAEAGLLLPLDDLVAAYRPQWTDVVFGYAGGEQAVSLLTRYRGATYAVALDNDTQPYFYRGDLLDDPVEQAAFEDRYGRPLRFPITWDEQAEVAEFFTRPDQELFGDVATLAPFWGVVNWQQRFVCSASPNSVYLNEDGSANVNNEAGVRAFEELLRSRAWHPPGALRGQWLDQFRLMGAGNGWGGGSFPTLTKLVPGNPDLDTADVGQFIRSDVAPGREVEGVLVRRSVLSVNLGYGVNALADPSRHEAAYLFLQWLTGARVHTLLTFNPLGQIDPYHAYSLGDPYVAQSYGPQPLGQLANVIPRTAPPVTLMGGRAYRRSLSDELQRVLRGQQSPEQAAAALEDRWNTITEKRGTETQQAALETYFQSFPRVTDPPGEELAVEEVSTDVVR